MIQLLYTVIVAQMALILTLLFKSPLRKLVILTLDRVKRGRGPVMVKTVGGTILIVLASSVYSMVKIQSRTMEAGVANPTDQVLMSQHMLEASLMGFMLFLSLMIDRLHHYIRELSLLRKTMEAAKKQNRSFEDSKNGSAEELKALGEEVAVLRTKIKKLGSECEAKAKEAKAAEAEAEALRKQSEGFLLEYDRLLADNQNLRNQLESIDQSLSQPDHKSNM
ncbi:B-cell receptor-associated protein 31 [Juglans microcarpa x Juglans regia]|uniref:B-cell receptor-associated protein 31 n=1 Tax=Juglans microcarpa x Juglans regia TaxID=2249226 RepID=UPI001B7E1BA2|nr:B-cell receptor-associated protein 31 [Juglans microcarpa x Juglans regia]